MILEEMTLKQYMGYKDIKLKDFKNRTSVSNILNKGVNIGKFNENYLGEKDYFPTNKTVNNIAETLGLTGEQTKTLIKNQLK